MSIRCIPEAHCRKTEFKNYLLVLAVVSETSEKLSLSGGQSTLFYNINLVFPHDCAPRR